MSHCREKMWPGIERQRCQHVAVGQMMLESGTPRRVQRAGWRAMQMANEVALTVTGHAVAEDVVVHPATNVDRVHLNEALVGKRRVNAGHRLIEQQGAPVKAARVER